MGLNIEKEMIKKSNPKRLSEMKKYGRIETYKKINSLLHKDLREGFILINHVLAIIDDLLDNQNTYSLDKIEAIFCRSFKGENLAIENNSLKQIQKLGKVLRSLHNRRFYNADKIYQEVIRYWKIDRKDRIRKFKILSAKELDNLNKNIGGSIGKQFLLFLTPNLNQKLIFKIANSYGRAIKYADNLSDLNDDLSRGYINISKEDLKRYELIVERTNPNQIIIKGNLKNYKQCEFQKIERIFEKSQEITKKVILKNKQEKIMIKLLEDVAISWLNQAREA